MQILRKRYKTLIHPTKKEEIRMWWGIEEINWVTKNWELEMESILVERMIGNGIVRIARDRLPNRKVAIWCSRKRWPTYLKCCIHTYTYSLLLLFCDECWLFGVHENKIPFVELYKTTKFISTSGYSRR